MWRGLLVALLAVLVGCSGRVELLTAPPLHFDNPLDCRTNATMGRLVADPTFGTVLMTTASPPIPVAWPLGDYGRVKGGEIQVVNKDGRVVATTGSKSWRVSGTIVNVRNVAAYMVCDIS